MEMIFIIIIAFNCNPFMALDNGYQQESFSSLQQS